MQYVVVCPSVLREKETLQLRYASSPEQLSASFANFFQCFYVLIFPSSASRHGTCKASVPAVSLGKPGESNMAAQRWFGLGT